MDRYTVMDIAGIGLMLIGCGVASWGILNLNTLAAAVGIAVISIGMSIYQTAGMKKVKEEIIKEIRKLGKQSKKRET